MENLHTYTLNQLKKLSPSELEQFEFLCEEFQIDLVEAAFEMLGESELFDGIVTTLEDYCY